MKKIFDNAGRNWAVILIIMFLAVTLLYVCIYREGMYMQVHDHLDSNPAIYKMMKDSGLFWTTGKNAPFLGGIDQNYLYSDLQLYSWLYFLLPTFAAIITGWYIKILMSIIGFYLLGKTIYQDGKDDVNIFIFCGFIYGICPTFPTMPFGFASLPLLLTLLIKLYRNFEWRYMILLLLYPMISNFVFFGLFICGYILVFFIIDWIYNKRPALRFLGAIIFLSAGYIIIEWRLFYVMLFSGNESIRSVMTFGGSNIGWRMAVKRTIEAFIYGHYHSASSHTHVALPMCLLYFIYLNFNYIKNKQYKKIFFDIFNLVAFFIAFNCIIYGIGFMPWFVNMITILMPPLKGLQLVRTIWLNAFSWYFALMIILCRLHWKTVFKFVLLILAFVSVCRIPNTYNHIRVNAHKFLYDTLRIEKYKYAKELLSYEEFYSPKLFERIKHDIDYQGEWSVIFGLQPSILYYNQISAIDGFLSYYPMSYKKKFDKLLEPCFNAYPNVKASFDRWAGRAYIFPNSPNHHPQNIKLEPEVDMLINPEVFREMGGKYVFSRVKIKNAKLLGLVERGVYDKQEGSPYTIYVYKTI